MQHQREVLWRADREGASSLRQSDRSSDRARHERVTSSSPRLMTIEIPTLSASKKAYPIGPPEEIVIGGKGDDEDLFREKPPKTIEINEGATRLPPKIIVVNKESAFVPDVIKVQDMTTIDTKSAPRKTAVSRTPPGELRSGRVPAKRSRKEEKPQKMPVDPMGVHRSTASKPLQSGVSTTVRSAEKSETKVATSRQSSRTFSAVSVADNTKPESPLLRPAPSHTLTSSSSSSSRGRDIKFASLEIQRKPSQDPPAAIAPTTSNKILPDFSRRHTETSTMQHYYRQPSMRTSMYQHVAASLDVPANLHQSWPTRAVRSSSLPHDIGSGGSSLSRRSHHPTTSSRAPPHWMNVTGTPEDWIRATKAEDIHQVSEKIAQHLLHEA